MPIGSILHPITNKLVWEKLNLAYSAGALRQKSVAIRKWKITSIFFIEFDVVVLVTIMQIIYFRQMFHFWVVPKNLRKLMFPYIFRVIEQEHFAEMDQR